MSTREGSSVARCGPAEGEAHGETKSLNKDQGMGAQPGMGRNPPGIQPAWPKTHPPW